MTKRSHLLALSVVVLVVIACVPRAFSDNGGCVNLSNQDASGQCGDSACSSICAGPAFSADMRDPRLPGFTVAQEGGRIYIADVAAFAERGGIRRGDELLAIDGEAVPIHWGAGSVWQSAGTHQLTLKRDGQRFITTIQSLRQSTVVAMLLRGSGITPVSLTTPPRTGPFVSGLFVKPAGSHLRVYAVLAGSPAARAGIQVGDVVIPQSNSSVESADYRSIVRIRVRRGNSVRSMTLRMQGLSDILQAPSNTQGTPKKPNRATS